MRRLRHLTLVCGMATLILSACGPNDTETATTAPAAANASDHDDAADHEWSADDEVLIVLDGDSVRATDDGVDVDGTSVTITAAGTYRLSGSLTDGQVVVDTADEGIVRVILDGVEVHSSTTSPLAVLAADEVSVVLEDGSANVLVDATTYVVADATTDEPNAALFSAADLTISGTGSLAVHGNANDGIASTDGLVITGGTIVVGAVDDGIRGKDYLIVDGGSITVDAGGDAIHSNDSIVVNGGELIVASGDDGFHADSSLVVNGGTVRVTQSYEGLEGSSITITGGDVAVVASDDGLNGASGNDSSGGGGPGGSQDTFTGTQGLTISGGTIVVDADGDGVDVNGSILMTRGTLLVNGPTEQMNGAIDYDGNFEISGGLVVAAGSSGMATAPSATSSQLSVLSSFDTQAAGTEVHIRSSDGVDIVTFTPSKSFSSILVSSADLSADATYEISVGGELVATTTTAEAVSTRGGDPGRP